MSKRTREKKSAKPQQPAKPDEISVGRRFGRLYKKNDPGPAYAKEFRDFAREPESP